MCNGLAGCICKNIRTGFFQYGIAEIFPMRILQTVIVDGILIIIQINGKMILILHLFEPLVGNVFLTLQAGDHRNQFFLKGSISGLRNCFLRKEKTHKTERQ